MWQWKVTDVSNTHGRVLGSFKAGYKKKKTFISWLLLVEVPLSRFSFLPAKCPGQFPMLTTLWGKHTRQMSKLMLREV